MKIFENVTDEQVELLGFDPRLVKPVNLIISRLLVLPPCGRTGHAPHESDSHLPHDSLDGTNGAHQADFRYGALKGHRGARRRRCPRGDGDAAPANAPASTTDEEKKGILDLFGGGNKNN